MADLTTLIPYASNQVVSALTIVDTNKYYLLGPLPNNMAFLLPKINTVTRDTISYDKNAGFLIYNTDTLTVQQLLSSDTWIEPLDESNPMIAPGDLIVGGVSGVFTRLPVNTTTTLQILSSQNSLTQYVSADVLSGVPAVSRLLSLNGIDTSLYQNQTFSLSTSGTVLDWVSINNNVNTHTLNIPLASTSGVTSGLLSNSDYLLFTSKEPTITAGLISQYWRGDKTWQILDTSIVPENTNLYFTSLRVLSTALAGYTLGSNAPLIATDTILGAFGKIQGQLNNTAANNQTFYIGTTQLAINRASSEQGLTGITSIDGSTLTLGGTTASLINIATGSIAQTLNIGTGSGVTTINIGGSGDTVNIAGTLTYVNTTDLNVSDKLITLNKGGAAASGNNSGIQIEENAVITGYAVTGNTRNSWVFSTPNTLGTILLTPAATAVSTELLSSSTANRTITFPDNSGTVALTSDLHSPVTLGTANGLSLVNQQLSLSLSSATTTGALSSSDWTWFNSQMQTRIEISDTNYTVTGINNQIIILTNITALRNIYLPAATTKGQTLTFIDESGKLSELTPLLGIPNGTDTINGVLYGRFVSPYNVVKIESNGSGKWTIVYTNIRGMSSGMAAQPTFTDNGNGSVTLGNDGGYALYANPSGSGNTQVVSINGGTYTLTDGVTNYIVANYNGGIPIIQVVTDVTTINETTIIPIFTIYRQGTLLHVFEWDELGDALPNKIHKSIVKTQRYRAEPGSLALGEAPTRLVTTGSGTVWTGAVPTALASFNSSTGTLQFAYHVAGAWTLSTITQYDNTQYDNGTDLVALSGSARYAVNFVYRSIGTDTECFIVLGSGNYQLGAAQIAQPPANLPQVITSHAILVGRIIVQNGASVATQIDSAFNVLFTPSGLTDHNSLANLQAAPNPVAGEYYHLSSSQATIATQAASSTLSGYLLNADWSTFNSKEPAIILGTTSQYWRGDKTWQNLTSDIVTEGVTNLYFTQTRVLSTLLTGYAIGANMPLAATDTVLGAFGKVQGQINTLQPAYTNLTSIGSLANSAGVLYNSGTGVFSYTTTPVLTGTNFTGIPNSALINSSITVNGATIALGSSNVITANTTNLLTIGNGLSGTSFNGSSAVTIAVSAANNTTAATYYPVFATSQGIAVNLGTGTNLTFNPSTGVLTSTTFSGSGASLTNIPASQLSGTISSTILGNSTLYIGTTAIALNRASLAQSLTGITSIDGSAATLTTARTIATSGDVTGTATTFNGSINISIPTTVTAILGVAVPTLTAGFLKYTGSAWTFDTSTYLIGTKVDSFNTRTGAVTLTSSDVTTALGYTPYQQNTALSATTGTFSSTVSASSFTGAGTGLTGTAASLSIGGNAATATTATNVNAANNTTNANYYPIFATSQGTSVALGTDSGFTFNPSTNLLTISNGALSTPSILYINGGSASAVLITTTTTANQVVDITPVTTARVIKYLISITSGTMYQASELLLVHDGTTPIITEYGILLTGTSLATLDANITSGNIQLLITPINASTTIKVIKTFIST